MSGKKIGLIIVFSIIIISGAYFLCRYFDIFNWYRIASNSMKPTLNKGEVVFASVLPTISKGDVVMYRATPCAWEESQKEHITMGRIVAGENDNVELRRGLLYVNEKFVDDTTRFAYFFYITSPNVMNIIPKEAPDENLYKLNDSVALGNFSYDELVKFGLQSVSSRYIDTVSRINPFQFNNALKLWSNDNFGPVKVPKNNYFILGDNRGNSIDSRQRGFVDKEHVLSKSLTAK